MRSPMKHDVFYHIYPLGACGAPEINDFQSPAGTGIKTLGRSIPRLKKLGITALYVGPLFESTAHGYDTLDYFWVDRRLGTNDDLRSFVSACHDNGIKVILDAVLNHTGRHFFAFKDLQEKTGASPYASWFKGVDFSRKSPLGDPFAYEGWSGHFDLAKLNTENEAVRDHLFKAVRHWIESFNIDGLRLDAADVLSPSFMDSLSSFARKLKPEFWLMGEVVHGDYRDWAREGRLDSVTNFEMYKGLWSSFNDRNFFEIAWTLNRQFGEEGLYRNLDLYNFADNHDVNRVASTLRSKSHLFPLYGLLFTVPGIPSLYYGSEWAREGTRTATSDRALRPAIDLTASPREGSMGSDLERAIARFIEIRKDTQALREGRYRQLHVESEQFAFMREVEGVHAGGTKAIVAVNASERDKTISVKGIPDGTWLDALDGNKPFMARNGAMDIPLTPSWLRILIKQ